MNTDKNMETILKQELQISEITETRLQETYKRIKKENQERTRRAKYSFRKATAAAAAVLLAVTATGGTAAAAYISGHTDFLQGMFGNTTKNSTQVKQVPADSDKDSDIMVTVPAAEYVSVDEEKADALIGDKISNEKLVKQIGEHTLTIENYVTDGNVSLMYFTLEREGGVTALCYDENLNEGKGAYFSDDADFYFRVTEPGGEWAASKMYVDLEKSTKDKLFVYDYMVWTSESGGAEKETEPVLEIETYSMTDNQARAEAGDDDDKYYELIENRKTQKETAAIPSGQKIRLQSIEESGNWICSFSPISISLNMRMEAESDEEALDPWCIKRIELKFKDGTSYVVAADDEVNNTGYILGTETEYRAAFNRIVDTKQISEVIINEHVYQVK